MDQNKGQTELIIGLMSGTSVDGIDAALVEFQSSSELNVLATAFTPFPESLRETITSTALNSAALFRCEDSPLHTSLASVYAEASLGLIDKAGLSPNDISAIANHGQTVRHEPNASPAFSLQLGDATKIAELTGIRTVSQFRQADLAAGGQGAPLMPAFHKSVLANAVPADQTAYIANIGGIANITKLIEPMVGFDTGPGNCLMDQWIAKHSDQRYDDNGKWANSGKVLDRVLKQVLSDPYFSLGFPKSTGTDYFNLDWLEQRILNLDYYAPQDIQATLLALTTETIALGLEHTGATRGSLYVCGGGAHNSALMTELAARLSQLEVQTTEALGVPADWVEAVGFAWLGYCCLHGISSNAPSVTGAKQQVVLGEIY